MTRVALKIGTVICALLFGLPDPLPSSSTVLQDVNEIVKRSVANNERNWKVAPLYTFTERDVIAKGGQRTSRTFEVLMIEGSPYQKNIEVNGLPLSQAELQREDRKLQRETERRQRETPEARKKRIVAYEQERRQDHALMREMVNAFTFTLAGRESVEGRQCLRVDASPRPGYVPRSRETKVLTGMRGTLWIDAAEYEWVRVRAVVFRPVAFGLFIAHVQPGTQFTLDEAPVDNSIWLPTHFEMRVKSTVLFWAHNSVDDETYSKYRRIAERQQ